MRQIRPPSRWGARRRRRGLAGQAIRAVALGVVVTALVQSVLGGIGLAIAGIPFAAPDRRACSCSHRADRRRAGAAAAAIWLFWDRRDRLGHRAVDWSLVVGSLDNILRPILIRKGADLPLLLIFAGVIGGLIAFGLIGLFVGPVVLAVTYTLLDSWVSETPDADVPASVRATHAARPTAACRGRLIRAQRRSRCKHPHARSRQCCW